MSKGVKQAYDFYFLGTGKTYDLCPIIGKYAKDKKFFSRCRDMHLSVIMLIKK